MFTDRYIPFISTISTVFTKNNEVKSIFHLVKWPRTVHALLMIEYVAKIDTHQHTHTHASIFIEFYCLLILWGRNFRKMFNEIQFHSCSLLLIKVSATLVGKRMAKSARYANIFGCYVHVRFFFTSPGWYFFILYGVLNFSVSFVCLYIQGFQIDCIKSTLLLTSVHVLWASFIVHTALSPLA